MKLRRCEKSRIRSKVPVLFFVLYLFVCGLFSSAVIAESGAETGGLDKAEHLIGKGRFSLALTQIESVLRQQPQHVRGRFLQARALFAMGKPLQAQRLLQDLLREQPLFPEIHNNLAAIYVSQGDFDGARRQLEQALATDSSYQVAYDNLTVVYNRLASQTYHKALSPDETLALPETRLAMISHLSLPVEKQDIAVSVNIPPPDSSPLSTGDEKAITTMIKGWARAWSAQKAEQYLGYYDDRFIPAAGLSSKDWAAKRRVRLVKPRYIRVQVDNVDIIPVGKGVVSVFIRQHYESDRLNDTVRKNLIIRKSDDKWRIFQESLVR